MESFVNRVTEWKLIDDAFAALLDTHRLLKTPILALHGVQGIGKSTVLRRIEERCEHERLPCIQTGVYQDMADCSRAILAQVGKYGQVLADAEGPDDWLERSIYATRALLRRSPAVMLIDSFDATNAEHLRWFEEFLKNVIDENKLFVVFTSQRRFLFARERSVARKVTSVELKPFDRESCQKYIDAAGLQIEGELRDLLFSWTHGYPLAMQIMMESMAAGLDPRKEVDRQVLLAALMERVVEQHLLAHIQRTRRVWYRTILRLLSVPRRFNLVMLRELIERFAPDLRRESNLAYFVLPKEINEPADILSWNMLRAGFSVDAPLRQLFLLELKLTDPDLSASIHDFLAQINRRRAEEVGGSDRIRYVREFLYHAACRGKTPDFPQQIRAVVEQMLQEVPTPEMFVQFSEEFQQDEELQEALGTDRDGTLSLLQRKLAFLNQQLAQQTTGPGRVHFLGEFFLHLMQDPQAIDLAREVKEQIELLIESETPDIVVQLYDELAHNEQFRTLLGNDLETVALMVRKNRPFEV